MNIILTGPCGVGKSTIGQSYANKNAIEFIDFDEFRAVEMEKARPYNSACSVTHLDLRKCLPSLLDALSKNFLLDIGGDTVFRPKADNEDRKNQILWLKINYSARLVLLTANRDILFKRFSTSKDRNCRAANDLIAEFDELWINWLCIGEPYWSECTDLQIDVSALSIKDTISQIEQGLNDNGISGS